MTTSRRRTPVGYDRWEAWWRFNGGCYLDVTSEPGLASQQSGGIGHFLGRGRAPGKQPEPVDEAYLRGRVLPELVGLLGSQPEEIAAAALLALAQATPNSAARAIRPYVMRAFAREKRDVLAAAVMTLGCLRDDAARATLLDLVTDSTSGRELVASKGGVPCLLRSLAALSLGLQGEPGAAGTLLRLAGTETCPELRSCLLLGASRAAPQSTELSVQLIRRLSDPGEDWRVRSQAVVALSRLNADLVRAAQPDLVRLLRADDSNIYLRLSVATALGVADPGSALVLDDLIETIGQSGEAVLRHACWMAVGQILERTGTIATGDVASREKALRFLAGRFISPARDSDRPWVALALGLALRHEPTSQRLRSSILPRIRRDLRRARAPSEVGALALAAGLLGDAEVLDPIASLLEDSAAEELAIHLIQAIRLCGNPRSAERLEAVLLADKTRPRVRFAAARALARLGARVAVDEVAGRLAETRSDMPVAWLARAIGSLRDPQSLAPLQGLVSDLSRPERQRAQGAAGMGWMAGPPPWREAYAAGANFHVRIPALDVMLQ